jgi:serine-type D-Ala-D-Ala carboxypeptidase/endopeptidase (penicillin-binding protein 4)
MGYFCYEDLNTVRTIGRFIRVRKIHSWCAPWITILVALLPVVFSPARSSAQLTERQQSPLTDLSHDLTDIFNDPRFSNATWGVAVQSMETGEYFFRLNDNKSLLPASNFKLFTTAEALSLLGNDFRYTTQLITTGRISDGTLRGDLIIRGAGDPTLGSQLMFPDSNPTFVFEAWADSLSKRGITRIDGSIVGDDAYFTDDLYPSGWAIEDMPYYYAMQTTGLAFDENQISVSVSPGLSPGSVVRYELHPNTDYVSVDNRGMTKQDSIMLKRRHQPDSVIATGATSIDITRDIGTNSILIHGEIPESAPVTSDALSVENPTLYAASVFREVLEEHGIEITGKTRTSRDLAKPIPYLKARVLASYVSPPLSDIIAIMNKHSDNLYAEELFRTVAKEVGGAGDWQHGVEVMKKYLASIDLDTARVAIYDGSGLSRMDLISPGQMVTLLRTMHERTRLWEAFYPSLSVEGVDGTLSSRLKGTRAEGNVHAKTGFLTGVRSISGYLTTRDGELVAFSIIGNNFTVPVSQANNLQDLVLLRLVNFSRK